MNHVFVAHVFEELMGIAGALQTVEHRYIEAETLARRKATNVLDERRGPERFDQ